MKDLVLRIFAVFLGVIVLWTINGPGLFYTRCNYSGNYQLSIDDPACSCQAESMEDASMQSLVLKSDKCCDTSHLVLNVSSLHSDIQKVIKPLVQQMLFQAHELLDDELSGFAKHLFLAHQFRDLDSPNFSGKNLLLSIRQLKLDC